MSSWFGPSGDCGCDCERCVCSDPEFSARAFSGQATLKIEVYNALSSFSYRGLRLSSFPPGYLVEDYSVSDIDINGTYFFDMPQVGNCISGATGTGNVSIGSWKLTHDRGYVPFSPSPAQCNSPDPISTTITDIALTAELLTGTGVNAGWHTVAIRATSSFAFMRGSTRCIDDYVFNKNGVPGTFNPVTGNHYTGKIQYGHIIQFADICGAVASYVADIADCTLSVVNV